MKAGIPKQFLLLGCRPLLMYSVDAFYHAVPGISIILTLPRQYIKAWNILCSDYSFSTPCRVVEGGETRFHSVKNGLDAAPEEGLVAIHDGVRPLVSAELIMRSFDAAEQFGNSIPAIPVIESLRILENGGSHPLERKNYRIIQTPQVFGVTSLRDAYKQPYREAFTDDATVFEGTGATIHLIEGDTENIKITTPDDLIIAECLLEPKG